MTRLYQSIIKSVAVSVTLVVWCSLCAPQTKRDAPLADERGEFRAIVPIWERIYFEEINRTASIAKLPSLRATALPKDDLEVRFWIGFGLTRLRGFDLKRSGGQWSGLFIQSTGERTVRRLTLQAPGSGWEELWQKLVNKGILTLPDATSIRCEGNVEDGVGYVVEYNTDNAYRTYLYDNPQYAKCKEAKQMIEIVEIFNRELGPQLPRY